MRSAGATRSRGSSGTSRATAPGPPRGRPRPEADAKARPTRSLPSNPALLSRLEHGEARRGAAYRPEDVVPSAGDRAYFVSRAASLLVSAEWERRNLGVKLLGLLHARDKAPLLLALFNDRRPASLLKRMVGGDFVQVGFIRRNIVTALGRLGDASPEVQAALLDRVRRTRTSRCGRRRREWRQGWRPG